MKNKRRLGEIMEEARRLHRAGDAAGALAGYRKILGSQPQAAEVLILAATVAVSTLAGRRRSFPERTP